MTSPNKIYTYHEYETFKFHIFEGWYSIEDMVELLFAARDLRETLNKANRRAIEPISDYDG